MWAQWAGESPSYGAFPFDGYQWLRDGSAIAGATGQAYTPAAGDIGHLLACTVTVTYPTLNVTASATGAGVMVIAQSSGPQGPQGPPGLAGQTGVAGPRGPAGQIELVTCQQVTVKVKHRQATREKCSGRLVSGPVKFTTASAGPASITRGNVIYALGQMISTRHGRSKLVFAALRPLRPGTSRSRPASGCTSAARRS
jgi:hypothetical protein